MRHGEMNWRTLEESLDRLLMFLFEEIEFRFMRLEEKRV